MNRSHKVLGFVLVVICGLYGCAKGPTSKGGSSEKNSPLEAKAQRLEEDYRAAAAARDQFRLKLLAAEEKHNHLQKQLEQTRQVAAADREVLTAEVQARLVERDTLAVQYDSFRRNLKDLLGQAETALANPVSPLAPALVGVTTSPVSDVSAALRN